MGAVVCESHGSLNFGAVTRTTPQRSGVDAADGLVRRQTCLGFYGSSTRQSEVITWRPNPCSAAAAHGGTGRRGLQRLVKRPRFPAPASTDNRAPCEGNSSHLDHATLDEMI